MFINIYYVYAQNLELQFCVGGRRKHIQEKSPSPFATNPCPFLALWKKRGETIYRDKNSYEKDRSTFAVQLIMSSCEKRFDAKVDVLWQ